VTYHCKHIVRCESSGTKFYVGIFVKDDDVKVGQEHTLSALPVTGDLGFIGVELVQLEYRADATYHIRGSCFCSSAYRRGSKEYPVRRRHQPRVRSAGCRGLWCE
jgi:transposase InsO family protein